MGTEIIGLRVCIDVDDLDRAIGFYTAALGLQVGRRLGSGAVELVGGPVPIDLLAVEAGSVAAAEAVRDYRRHWTPVHLDVVVADLNAAVRRAVEAGAVLERPPASRVWGKIAVLADPFGHGLCLLEMSERGYDALVEEPGAA